MEGLGVRLRGAREKKGLSQAEVARRLGGVGRTAVTRWESEEKGSGKGNEPDFDTLTRLAAMYDVSLYYLAGESEERPVSQREAETVSAADEGTDWREIAKSLARAQEKRVTDVDAVYAQAALRAQENISAAIQQAGGIVPRSTARAGQNAPQEHAAADQ